MDETQIEAYLNNELSSDERNQFQEALKNNQALKQALEAYLLTQAAIRFDAREQEMEELKGLRMAARKKKSQTFRLYALSALAASLLLIMLVFYFLPPASPSPEQLFADNFTLLEKGRITTNTMGGTSNQDSLKIQLNSAVISYLEQDFDKASREFQQLLENKSFDAQPIAYLCLGTIYLKQENYAKAQAYLQQIGDDTAFYNEKLWYLALLDIKTKQLEGAKQKLTALRTPGNPYFDKARKILEALETV